MNRYASILSALLLVAAAVTAQNGPFVFQDESALWLEGSSNVHAWSCDVASVAGALFAPQEPPSGDVAPLWDAGRVTVPVSEIECGNGTMNRKLRDALGAERHPQIVFEVNDVQRSASEADGWFDVRAKGALKIAGSTREVLIESRAIRMSEGRYRLIGATEVLMTDFGVNPPTALLGTLKTGDAVTVRFDVIAAR